MKKYNKNLFEEGRKERAGGREKREGERRRDAAFILLSGFNQTAPLVHPCLLRLQVYDTKVKYLICHSDLNSDLFESI